LLCLSRFIGNNSGGGNVSESQTLSERMVNGNV